MTDKKFIDILGNFTPAPILEGQRVKDGVAVTIWIPVSYKQKYDNIQKSSGRLLSKKLREIAMNVIDAAEEKISCSA
jgi:23S rRNA A2030 N6-methylase RlmJ